MLKIGTVILCMTLIGNCCESKTSENKNPQEKTPSYDIGNIMADMGSYYDYYEDTLRFALPGECKDYPDNLVTYSDSLLKGITELPVFSPEEISQVCALRDIKKAFAELQRYKEGKRKYYPQEDLYKIFSYLQGDLSLLLLHCDDIHEISTINIFFRLIEQAVRLCPDINFLSKVCSNDHWLGTLDFHERYSLKMGYSLIYRKPNGQYDVFSFKGYGRGINRIRMIKETATYRRYLLSIELENPFSLNSFKVWIVDLYSNGKTRVIIPEDGEYLTSEWQEQAWIKNEKEESRINPLYQNAKIIFSPQSLSWSYCQEKDSIYYPIKESTEIVLVPEKDSAYFIIQ